MMVELLAVMRKEIRQALRDRRMATMLLLAPVIQLTVLGYAVDLDVDEIPTVVCDLDRTPSSRSIMDALLKEGTFQEQWRVHEPESASELVESGDASVAVVIPSGFERDLAREAVAEIQILVDGTDPNRAQIASASASQIVARRATELSTERLSRAYAAQGRAISIPQVQLIPRVYYNPSMRSATYMVPGVAAVVLLIITTIVTAMGIAREREMGTLEQLLVTPLRPYVLLLGKSLPFAAIGMFDTFAILTVGSYLFDVPIRGSLLVIVVATALYLLSTLGMGIFISTVSATQQQAILGGFFFLLPAILLSGFMTPIENMPWWIRPITYANPVRYYLEVLRGVMLKGAGFEDLTMQLLALGGFGSFVLLLSATRFRKRLG